MVAKEEALAAMRTLLILILLFGLAKSGLDAADFNATKNRRVLVVAGAGGELEYAQLFADWAETLAKAFEGNAAELVYLSNGPEETGARKTCLLYTSPSPRDRG